MKDSNWDFVWMAVGLLLVVGLKPLIIILALLSMLIYFF